MKKIVLASGSPRRKKLLEEAGLRFVVEKSTYEEYLDTTIQPVELAKKLSYEKALNVAKRFTNALIIGADTVVVLDKKLLGKPKDAQDAKRMLSELSNTSHTVITGYTIIDTDSNRVSTNFEETFVRMKPLSEKQIEDYIATGEPFDKAGGYGIQDGAGPFIAEIRGDFTNVVGLPVEKVLKELEKFGI
ncbi:MAG: septum formation protein Maf [Candidatus Levybacteria bacterium]|nr:septum formation protein Maf [Candidatus Levybacteria bacterium]